MLTKENTDDIERIQKIVLRIVMNTEYSGYHNACITLNVPTLQTRRVKLSLSFALKCVASDKFNHFFKQNIHTNIRSPDMFDVPFAHTSRYFNSPKVYLTRLLNNYFRNEQNIECSLLVPKT